jgi:hypothetical protein
MNYIQSQEAEKRRCTNCKDKPSCSAFEDKQETTPSEWDKNRFAISCKEYGENE